MGRSVEPRCPPSSPEMTSGWWASIDTKPHFPLCKCHKGLGDSQSEEPVGHVHLFKMASTMWCEGDKELEQEGVRHGCPPQGRSSLHMAPVWSPSRMLGLCLIWCRRKGGRGEASPGEQEEATGAGCPPIWMLVLPCAHARPALIWPQSP